MISEWLRGRVLRWLANGGGGVTLGVQGAYFVQVDAAGQVIVNGGKVVAKNCQVLQDSTGERILTEPEQFMNDIAATVAKPVANAGNHSTVEKLKRTIAHDRQAVARQDGRGSAVLASSVVVAAQPGTMTTEKPPAKPKPRKRVPAATAGQRLTAPAGKANGWAAHNAEKE